MQRLAEYLEHARQFEHLAAEETDPEIKAQFEKQAAAYRKLAERSFAPWGSRFKKNPRGQWPVCLAGMELRCVLVPSF